jgi:hypothetical protein
MAACFFGIAWGHRKLMEDNAKLLTRIAGLQSKQDKLQAQLAESLEYAPQPVVVGHFFACEPEAEHPDPVAIPDGPRT